jgi:hypothetical protein
MWADILDRAERVFGDWGNSCSVAHAEEIQPPVPGIALPTQAHFQNTAGRRLARGVSTAAIRIATRAGPDRSHHW